MRDMENSAQAPATPWPPHNADLEQQILGALLNNNDLIDAEPQIDPTAFFEPLHAALFEAMRDRIRAGAIASPVSMRDAWNSWQPGANALGGSSYLVKLSLGAMSSYAYPDYCRMLADYAAKRKLAESISAAEVELSSGVKSAAQIAIDLENNAGAVLVSASVKPLVRTFLDTAATTIQRLNDAYMKPEAAGISTGIPRLDSMLSYLRPGNFIVLAGRPAMGKTTAAQNFAWSALKQGHGVFYGSLEMTAEELATRFFSKGLAEVGINIPYNRMIKGELSEQEFRQVLDEARRSEDKPLIIGERDARDIARIRSAARRARQRLEGMGTTLGLVVIDYVQLLASSKAKSAYDRVSEASDFCKSLAMELAVPVVGLSQLSRGVEAREPPVPMLSDLRESGKLEEDADAVLFTYREEYYRRKELEAIDQGDRDKIAEVEAAVSRVAGKVDLIVAKQRSGPTGTVTAYVNMGCCHLMADRPADPGALL